MAWFIARIMLHRATAQNYLDLHDHMREQGLNPSFRQGEYRYHLPDATYAIECTETLDQVQTRAVKALTAAKYKPASEDAAQPPFGTYSSVVIGPSSDFDHHGLRREELEK